MRNLLCNQTWFNRILTLIGTQRPTQDVISSESESETVKFYRAWNKRRKPEKKRVDMFCPSANETITQLTEKTKLFAKKCSSNVAGDGELPAVATFKSYLSEDVETSTSQIDENFDNEKSATQSPLHQIHPLQCLTVNLTNLNRLIKSRCSFVSTTSQSCFNSNTFPRKKKSPLPTAMWYIKVSI